jgi:hypothetical protein
MSVIDNLAKYVSDHTSCSEVRWHNIGPEQRGPLPISAVSTVCQQGIEIMPARGAFLELVRSHQGGSDCNPLDGEEHGFAELSAWLPGSGLVRRFVGLGVILGVFDLVAPWRNDASYEEQVSFYQEQAGGSFKFRLNHYRHDMSGNS